MKKQYVVPQVEKVEFNYAETVTASNSGRARIFVDGGDDYCGTRYLFTWLGNMSDDGICQKITEPEYQN